MKKENIDKKIIIVGLIVYVIIALYAGKYWFAPIIGGLQAFFFSLAIIVLGVPFAMYMWGWWDKKK